MQSLLCNLKSYIWLYYMYKVSKLQSADLEVKVKHRNVRTKWNIEAVKKKAITNSLHSLLKHLAAELSDQTASRILHKNLNFHPLFRNYWTWLGFRILWDSAIRSWVRQCLKQRQWDGELLAKLRTLTHYCQNFNS